MSYDYLCLQALLDGRKTPARHILYTTSGMGANCFTGYPADLARAISPDIITGMDEHWFWQPVSYGPGGVPAAFPMQTSIDMGVAEWTRLMLLQPPTQTWGFCSYSEGAIVAADIMDVCGITSSGTVNPLLAPYAASFIGGITLGGPRREKGHTCPGGIDPGGHGIVKPQLVGTPSKVWDFAAGKNMAGSPGQDLYTTCGYDGDQFTEADEEAVWEIVRQGTIQSGLPLVEQLLGLLTHPLQQGPGALMAILDALNFFVVTGLTPHTTYQTVQPIAGDGRSSWDVALDYLHWMGTNVPAHL